MTKSHLMEERLTRSIIGAFFEVYNTLGFGFLEHVYVMALERELIDRGHRVAREVSVHVSYKDHILAVQRIDMIVDDKVVVETKAGPELPTARNAKFSTTSAPRTWKLGSYCTSDWKRVSTDS